MVKIILFIIMIASSGCLTMGAKLEVQRLLAAHQEKHSIEVGNIARSSASVRIEEILKDRLPTLVESQARSIAGDRSLEVLEARIPGMVDEAVALELKRAGLTPEFTKSTSDGIKELGETDWAQVAAALGTALIAAWMAKDKIQGRRSGNGGGKAYRNGVNTLRKTKEESV